MFSITQILAWAPCSWELIEIIPRCRRYTTSPFFKATGANMGKNLNFESIESLSQVTKIIDEAGAAIKDPHRTILTSSIPEVLGAVAGMGVGAAASFTALYTLGTVGLSAAGITSGLAAAGAIVGGGMAAGLAVLAAPVAILGVVGYGIFASKKHKRLVQAKGELLRQAILMRDGIIRELKVEVDANKDRLEYLNSLNIMLTSAVRDLQADLAA
jgi:hypothetical protein